MSMMKRISMIFRAKANKALDRAEDPRETLDYSYQRQVEMLAKVRRGVADAFVRLCGPPSKTTTPNAFGY